MPDGGNSMEVNGVGITWEVNGTCRTVAGAAGVITGAAGAGTGTEGTGAIVVGEDVPLAVTVTLARPVLEPPPRRCLLLLPWLLLSRV